MSVRELRSRFMAWAVSVPVRVKIMGIALGLTILLGLAVTLLVRVALVEAMRAELTAQGRAIARDVAGRAENLILTDDLFALQELVGRTMESQDDTRYVFIVGRDGQVLAHTFGERVPADLLAAHAPPPEADQGVELLETETGMIYDFAAPILKGEAGVARVGMSERRVWSFVQRITWLLLTATALVSLVGVGGAYILTLILTKPILQLVDVTQAVGKGDFSHKAPIWAMDEIGRLSMAFNAMIEALDRSREEIEGSNRQLRRANDELTALYAIALTVSRSLRLEEILDGALAKVLEVMQLRAGWIFLHDNREGRLKLVAQQGLSPSFAHEEAVRELGECVCRAVMESGEVRLLESIQRCPRLSPELLAREGLRGHASVPLKAKEQVLGVINVAWDDNRRFSDDELRLLQSIGHQIGIAIDNARLYEEVQQKEELRRQLLEKLILAQEEERRRVARELHDETSQALVFLQIGLERLVAGVEEAERARYLAAELERVAAQTRATVHRLALELRPSMLDDMGLLVAIRRYLYDCARRWGLAVDFAAVGADRLRLIPATETAIYRIVQAALTNVGHHAKAQSVSVAVERRADEHLTVIIEDDGLGFDLAAIRAAPLEKRLGLAGMEERAALIGATLTIETSPGAGTTLFLEVPLGLNVRREEADVEAADHPGR